MLVIGLFFTLLSIILLDGKKIKVRMQLHSYFFSTFVSC